MRWFSSSQSPRSISRQRSQQNGRHLDAGSQSTERPQVGQLTIVVMVSVVAISGANGNRGLLTCRDDSKAIS